MKTKFRLNFCLMMISSMLSFSQTNYKAGFIVKEKDTLYGEIDYRNDKNLSEICRFKKGDVVKEYTPEDIDAYRFKDDRLFVSEEIGQKKVFLEVLIKGKLNVFSFTEILGTPRYFISNDKYSLKEVTYPEEDVARAAKNYIARLNRHKALLNVYTYDAPSLKSKIESINQPTRKNLIKFAKTYHTTVCDTEKCIVYESKPKKIKILTELRFGIKSYTDAGVYVFQVTKKIFFYTEGVIRFSIPNLGNNWYIKTGLSLFKQTYNKYRDRVVEEDKIAVQVPLQIQYIMSEKKIRPKLSYGLLMGSAFSRDVDVMTFEGRKESALSTGDIKTNIGVDMLVGVGLGVDIKILKNMFVSLNSDFEFGRGGGFILPKKLYSTNVTGGLVYQF